MSDIQFHCPECCTDVEKQGTHGPHNEPLYVCQHCGCEFVIVTIGDGCRW